MRGRLAAGLLTLLLLAAAPGALRAQPLQPIEKDFSPGFGVVLGQGETQNGALARRFGFTSRRIRDNERSGSLGLFYDWHTNGIDYDLLDDTLTKKDVTLKYDSIYMELKRYFPTGTPLNFYWGLRGGYTRVQGKVRRGEGQENDNFEADSFAPLWWLALPFVLEHPGFLLLAAVDGSSAGITFDIIPKHVWVDLNLGTTILPAYRDKTIALSKRFVATGMLELVVVF